MLQCLLCRCDCSKTTKILGNDANIMWIWVCLYAILSAKKSGEQRKLHPTEQTHIKHTHAHTRNAHQETHFTVLWAHPFTSGVKSLGSNHIILQPLHSNSQAASPLMPISQGNFRFFKVKCYIYCNIYVFLNHLTCKNVPLCFILLFCVLLRKFCVLCL